MKKLHLSVWRGKLELENAQITHVDSSAGLHFIVRLPIIYIELKSWNDLLFKKKLSIDSVMLTQPSFEVFEDSSRAPKQKIVFQSVRIFEAINKAVELFNVRSLHLADGSFIYHPGNGAPPFESHRINISIGNFARDSNNLHRFMSADEVEIAIGAQDWKLDDNNKEIKFKQLQFSGKKQSFELDSLQYSSRTINNESALTLSIAKLTFTSKQLSAFYENNELLIDTLHCIRPVVQLQLNKDTSSIDTSSVISESLKSIFANIHIKFLDIDQGQFTIDEKANGKSSHYATEKTNLKIDDLDIRPDETPFLTTGNIDLKLNTLQFYTPDSLYQLTLDEFDLYNNDLRFKNAFFSPAPNNHKQESFFIRIPVLALKNLDLKKLLEKRLVAEVAQMENPVVTIQSRGEKKKNKTVSGNWSGFYDGLQGISELMEVKMFNIKNGTINYRSLSDSSLTAKVSGFNISVLLNDFLNSKSLQDIKHSIPYLEAAAITFHSQALTADVTQLGLFDSIHHNMINKIELTLANGMTLKGKKIVWRKLNWDELKNRNAIVADSINIDELNVRNGDGTPTTNGNLKDLPVIRIRKLGINEFKVHYTLAADSSVVAKAKGKNILFTDLSTLKDKLLWRNATGVFTNFEYNSPGVTASSDKIKFEAPGKTRLSDIKLDVKNRAEVIRGRISEINVETTVTSTDFSRLEFPTVIINEPSLNVIQTVTENSTSKPHKIPFDFAIGSMSVNGGQIIYKLNNGTDSMQVSSVINASLNSLRASGSQSESLHINQMNITLSKIIAHGKKLDVSVPSMEFTASDATIFDEQGETGLKSFISGHWNHATMDILLNKDSKMDITNFSGTLSQSGFDLKQGQKFQWMEWMNRINILSARLLYSDSIRTASLNNIKWSASTQDLRIDSFTLQPRLNPGEYFSKTPWQSDLISLHGGLLTVSGIDFDKWENDSLFQTNKIAFSDVTVDVWRDKRVPFRHGFEVSMPAQLINSIAYRLNIDSVTVTNGDIFYHEFSNITNREGTVPLENINATMQNVKNYHSGNEDTLTIRGKAKLLNSSIKKFRYAEAYNDSLGSFRLSVKASPGQLNEFSKISNPLAAVNIDDGILDTMVVRISGNKYAAIGEMLFYYHDLKVSFLDREDATQKRISLSFVNFVANRFVIKSNNRKESKIFYIRDREKFVFNYWIKSIMSGMLTSAGVKNNNAYDKQYQKLKDQYALPELNF
ncbi:MAG TPA: hypothetical protein VE978_00100 [Chitinophagales bacterium]|nr:hypothetical protein [Chitinophagales bacterium]